MNLLLSFKDKKVATKHLTYQLQKSFQINLFLNFFLIINLIYIIIYLSLGFYDKSFIMDEFSTKLYLILGSILLFFFLIVSGLYILKKTSMDLTYFISYIYFLSLTMETVNDSPDDNVILVESYRIWILNMVFLTCYKTFFLKILQTTINLICVLKEFSEWSFHYRQMILWEGVMLTILSIFILYFQERNEKFAFLRVFYTSKEKKSFLKFLNILPEGIGIFEYNTQALFFNESFKSLYIEKNTEFLREKFLLHTKKRIFMNNKGKDEKYHTTHSETTEKFIDNKDFNKILFKNGNFLYIFIYYI